MKTKLIIFGMTGDLSTRKLLPALSEIVKEGRQDLSIIGVSRRDVNVRELLEKANAQNLEDHARMFTMDLAEASDYVRLKGDVALANDEQALIYLSVPPSASADIVDFLGQAGLNGSNVKILFEKPFGYDLESAHDFIQRTARYFEEDQIYRIDHYMAKELAQEIIRLRSNAENKHHGWSNKTIESIGIVASESLGVGERGVFYEQTGALRDFLQGHLMQLLALMIMDNPANFPLEELPSHRFAALEHIAPADPMLAVRAQYKGYDEEVGNPGSLTETLAQVQLKSEHPRWAGVDFLLMTAKKMAEKRSYIGVRYRDGTEETFEESVLLGEGRLPDAYERVLVEAIEGRKYLFTTSPEVLRSWEILTPVQEAWAMNTQPLHFYKPGMSFDDNDWHFFKD